MAKSLLFVSITATGIILGAVGCGVKDPLAPVDPNTIANLTDDPHQEIGLTWSPDGNSIAYLRINLGTTEVVVLDIATRETEVLAETVMGVDEISWSPDGSQILLASSVDPSSPRVVTYPGGLESAFDHPCQSDDSGCIRYPFWSYDGTRLAAEYDDSPDCDNPWWSKLIVYDLGSYDCTIRTIWGYGDHNGGMSWSNTGDRVAYHYNLETTDTWRIRTIDAQTGAGVQVTSGNGTDMNPEWSPDDTQICLSSQRGGQWDIWVAKSDGSTAPFKITDDAATESATAWSPTGTAISYLRDDGGVSGIWLVPSDGSSDPVCLTPAGVSELGARWAKSNPLLACIRHDGNQADIWVRYIPD